MKPLINLAGEPFQNRRLFWLCILLVFALSGIIGLRGIRTLSQLEAQIASRTPAIQTLEARAKALASPPPGAPGLTLEQRRIYWAANELISRKAFSWTQLLNDIERHIPSGVRLLRVSVSRGAQQNASGAQSGKPVALTMEVVGKSVTDVTQMIADFNRSGVFIATPKWQKPVEGLEEIQFGLEIEYQPSTATQATSSLTAERRN